MQHSSSVVSFTRRAADRSAPAFSNASQDALVMATSQIVAAHLVAHPNDGRPLNALMADVYGMLVKLSGTKEVAVTSTQERKPMVSIEESVKADYLVCLEDGKRVKMLKRHLKTAYGMSPEQYRARWNLPATYPMVAPNYAKVRSKLAKQIGLGRRALPSAKQRMDIAAGQLR